MKMMTIIPIAIQEVMVVLVVDGTAILEDIQKQRNVAGTIAVAITVHQKEIAMMTGDLEEDADGLEIMIPQRVDGITDVNLKID
jgi:hypothetical protein